MIGHENRPGADVVLAGAGWRNEPHQCLVLTAKRIALPYATEQTLAELQRVARTMQEEGWFRQHDPWRTLKLVHRFCAPGRSFASR